MDAGGSVAEGVGFEPTEACTSAVFKTTAFVHSATPPERDSIAGLLGPHALRYFGRFGHDRIKLADVG